MNLKTIWDIVMRGEERTGHSEKPKNKLVRLRAILEAGVKVLVKY